MVLTEEVPEAAGVHVACAHICATFLPLETLPGPAPPLCLLPEHLSEDAVPGRGCLSALTARGVDVRAHSPLHLLGDHGLGPDVNGETLGASYPENSAPMPFGLHWKVTWL